MNDELETLELLYNTLLTPNGVLNELIDRFEHSKHREAYLSLWERLTDMECEVSRIEKLIKAELKDKEECKE